jgi:ubiquinone biosynthesis protein Coq4
MEKKKTNEVFIRNVDSLLYQEWQKLKEKELIEDGFMVGKQTTKLFNKALEQEIKELKGKLDV